MIKQLDRLKYEIYKKSGKADYLTFKQFIQNENVSYTFKELQNKKRLENKNKKIIKGKQL